MRIVYYSLLCCLLVPRQATAQQQVLPVYAQTAYFQLAAPQLIYPDLLFSEQVTIRLQLDLAAASIRYTLDGSEPTEQSPLFQDQLVLYESAQVKAKAFHPSLAASETVAAQFIKLGAILPIKAVSINMEPHESYPGSGATGLVDRQKGSTNFRTSHWMGFAGGKLETLIEFATERSVQRVTASILVNPGAWVFPPARVIVYGSKDGTDFHKLNSITLVESTEDTAIALRFLPVTFAKSSWRFLKVELTCFEDIPAWHPGAGTAPWLFVDELLIH